MGKFPALFFFFFFIFFLIITGSDNACWFPSSQLALAGLVCESPPPTPNLFASLIIFDRFSPSSVRRCGVPMNTPLWIVYEGEDTPIHHVPWNHGGLLTGAPVPSIVWRTQGQPHTLLVCVCVCVCACGRCIYRCEERWKRCVCVQGEGGGGGENKV